MRLATARIQGFRCVRDLTIRFDDLTALIGSGGVGKSACLRALDWCINERTADPEDLYGGGAGVHAIAVMVTFTDLTQSDREVLGRYGTGDSTTFTRTWRPGDGAKLSGSALVFPGFDKVRELKGVQRRKAYQDLFKDKAEALGLPSPMPTKVDEVERDMEQFEREHPDACELRTEDASHLFGFTGGPKLRECFDYVLVDASADAPGAFGAGRDSALSRLLASIGTLDDETQQRVDALQEEARSRIEDTIGDARSDALAGIAGAINDRVREYVPDAEIELTEELAPFRAPAAQPIVRVRDGSGYSTDVERQGHGLQRALVIAVLQALADSHMLDDDDDASENHGRALMLSIEEPELYQHPLQARALADALQQLAGGPSDGRPVQIAYSTHSSHFVRPTLFESLRLLRRGDGGQTIGAQAKPAAVSEALAAAGMSGALDGKVRTTLSNSLREAVFARAVLLCEGPTDAALIKELARKDRGLERDGIAVAVCWGKSVIPIALAILKQLGIPTYVFFDADAGKQERLERKPKMTGTERTVQLAKVKAKNRQLLELCGEPPVDWPARAVNGSCANLKDNLETDIAEIWPELAVNAQQLASELGMPAKSEEIYRQAAGQAGDTPEFFTKLIARVRAMAKPGSFVAG